VTPADDLQQPCTHASHMGDVEAPPSVQRAPLDSSTLLRGDRSVEIRHNGEVYRLQSTRLGKLILTK
jgi:hemin uptake protein HemP